MQLCAALRIEPAPAMEEALARLCERARAERPTLAVPAPELMAFLAGRPPAGADAVDALFAGDLLLACACARSDPEALRILEESYFSRLPARLGSLRLSPAEFDETLQALRVKLLVDESGARIHDYQGRGPLQSWLGVAALRVALNLRRAAGRELSRGSPADALAQALPDTESAIVQESLREPFREAFRAAVAGLADRDRALLRLHYLEGIGGERLASAHRVHRATMTRWLAAARESLLEDTCRRLGEGLRLGRDELDSLLRAVRSRLEVSLPSLLRDS
jgi:RNA polymerase sigma-70 factor (ECF subfamily)